MIVIADIKNIEILNELNKDVQNWHHENYPKRFKKHCNANMKALFTFFIEKENAEVLMKIVNGNAVGYLIYEIRKQKESPFSFEYDFVYVHHVSIVKTYQNNGYANELLEYVKDKAKGLKINILELDVWSRNLVAKKYFQKKGFDTYNYKLKLEI